VCLGRSDVEDAMGVIGQQQRNETELARFWVDARARVLHVTTRSFPAAGSVLIETAVDQAWVELYEQGHAEPSEALLGRWTGLAYLRALNGVRERRRHPLSPVPVEELADGAVDPSHVAGVGLDALREQARAQEIVYQVSGEGRRWLEAVFDTPAAPPRELAGTLGWEPEKLKSVARRTRARLREFVSARASGAVCERRQAVMAAFAATQLVQRGSAQAARLDEHQMLSSERYQQVALHIAGCEECERAWRKAQNSLLRPSRVFLPIGVYGKVVAAGGSAFAAARHGLGRLNRLLFDLRIRVGSSVGRVSAGGAAGTAGTAGALAGKGAAVCVGVLCATGVGTAALVGIPAGIITARSTAHRHHGAVMARGGQGHARSASAVPATVLGSADSGPVTGQSVASSTPSGASSSRSGTARSSSKPTRPVTPGSLIRTSSATNASKVESEPSARAASTSESGSASRSEVSTEYVPAAASSSSRSSSSSSAKPGPCVPGSLSC
jgi:hypothetical protein